MKDIRIDPSGQFHCWSCGGITFRQKRTFRSKLLLGFVLCFLTKKKMQCLACGKYNDVGNAKPYRTQVDWSTAQTAAPGAPVLPGVPWPDTLSPFADLTATGPMFGVPPTAVSVAANEAMQAAFARAASAGPLDQAAIASAAPAADSRTSSAETAT